MLPALPRRLPALAIAASLALAGCLTVQPLPTTTPPPAPPSPSSTPTIAFPTLVPTATVTPAPSPTATPDIASALGELLFAADFSSGQGWPLGETDTGAVSMADGRLLVAVRRANTYRYALAPVTPLADFYAEVTLRAEVCSSDDTFGLMFRVNPQEEHYRFILDCDGSARVERALTTVAVPIVPATQTHAAFPGPLVDNRLGVLASGDIFTFFINGTLVFSVRDGTLPTGGLGLFIRSGAGGQTTVSFADLSVHALLSTPTPTHALP